MSNCEFNGKQVNNRLIPIPNICLKKGKSRIDLCKKRRSQAGICSRAKISTFRKISRRRKKLLVGKASIQDKPSHLQSPAGMDFKVAMHEPHTYMCIYI